MRVFVWWASKTMCWASLDGRRRMLGVIDAGEGGQRMTYRCESCQINWAPYQTRAGECLACGAGTNRVTTEEPDADAADRHRAILRAEADLQRKLTCYAEFAAFYAARELKRGPDAWREAA
jgi:hypothetical protein